MTFRGAALARTSLVPGSREPRWGQPATIELVSLRRVAGLLPAAAAISGAALVFWATARGPGLTPDSLAYLGLAGGLARGEGYVFLGEPNAHFPPLYPALLALVNHGDPDRILGARLLSAGLAAANALLAAAVVRACGGTPWGAGLAALWIACAPRPAYVHTMLWSEALFVSVSLLAALALWRHAALVTTGSLAAAGVALALVPLARYAGLVLAPVFGLALVRHGSGPVRERARRGVALALMGLLPAVAWAGRNVLVAGSASDRILAWHPPSSADLAMAASGWADLLGVTGLPPALTAALALASLAALFLGSLRACHGHACDATPVRVARAALLWSSAFSLLLLLAALSFVDADFPFDARLLAPVAVWAGVATLASRPARRGIVAALGFVAVAATLPRTVALVADLNPHGEGFATATWRESPTLAAARRLPEDARLYSNVREAVAILAGRDALDIPERWSGTSLLERPGYAAEVRSLCDRVRAGVATLVLFDYADWRWQAPTPNELVEACGVPPQLLADGRIVRRPPEAR